MSRRAVLITAFLIGSAFGGTYPVSAHAAGCATEVSAENGDGFVDTGGTIICDPGRINVAQPGRDGSQTPVTQVFDCGHRSGAGGVVNAQGETFQEINCLHTLASCMLAPGEKALPNTTVTMTATQQGDGTWTVTSTNCASPKGTAQPQVTGVDVRQEAQKLVPHPTIGTAPPGGTTLVNIETLLWVDTPSSRPLGTVTLLGHQVQITVALASVAWTFGDGHSETTPDAGTPYDRADPCSAKLCDDYWGHVFTTTGAHVITATITWTGTYRVDAGPAQTIPGTVTGPPSTVTITARQARGILVRD